MNLPKVLFLTSTVLHIRRPSVLYHSHSTPDDTQIQTVCRQQKSETEKGKSFISRTRIIVCLCVCVCVHPWVCVWIRIKLYLCLSRKREQFDVNVLVLWHNVISAVTRLWCKPQVSGNWGNRRKRARNRQSGGYTICLAASRISVAQYLFTWFSALLTTFSTLWFLRSYSLNCSAGCLHWNVGEREDRKWNEGHVDSMCTILSFAWIYFQGLKAIVLMAAFPPEYIFFYLTLILQICNNTKSHFKNM